MKVLFLSAANSIHTVRWVNSLADKGVEIHLVSLINHFEDERNKISSKVRIYYLPIHGNKGYYLNKIFLKRIIKKINPDIINTHYLSGYGTLARLANFKKTLVNVWGSDIYDFPKESSFKRKVIEKNLSKINYIASTSNVMAEEIKKYLKTNKKIEITPFGIDTNLFLPNHIKKEKIIIGTIKTLKEKYGIEYLIKAFSLLKKEYKNKEIELWIYGEGELKISLEELSENLNIKNEVIFKGYISNKLVPQALNRIDIFVVPSINESFGVSAVEAMSCELPVVASDADGFTEVIENEITGYIVPKKNEEKLAEKIKLLIDSKELRLKMGKNGRERVKKLYEWDNNVNNMINLYKRMKLNDN